MASAMRRSLIASPCLPAWETRGLYRDTVGESTLDEARRAQREERKAGRGHSRSRPGGMACQWAVGKPVVFLPLAWQALAGRLALATAEHPHPQ